MKNNFRKLDKNKEAMAVIISKARIVIGIIGSGFIFLSCNPVFGQQSFTPLKQGEYEIREETQQFNIGVNVKGTYDLFYDSWRDGFLVGGREYGKIQQNIELDFKSTINTNLSLNVTLANKTSEVTSQDSAYETTYAYESGDSTGDDGMNVIFKEAFLEYNHNPNARLKIGKHEINPGGKSGLVFNGIATAISQECRIGTWCYYVGGARIAEDGNSALFWAQLDYPVYESGVLITDPWSEKGTRQQVSLNVEMMRVTYSGFDVPVSKMGTWTGNKSLDHETFSDASSDYVYFNDDGIDYMGLNVNFNYYDFVLNFSWLYLKGTREYFYDTQTVGKTFFATQELSGNAFSLDLKYRLNEEWQGSIETFYASGNKLESDNQRFWENNSTAYLEVKKGAYGDALAYFNGRDGVGQGHSVSNLTYFSIRGSYKAKDKRSGVDLALYSFLRSEPVYTNVSTEPEKKESGIGNEFDVSGTYKLENNLLLTGFIAYFLPQGAYAENDNDRPTGENENFTLVGAGLKYMF
ncbi:hypothetical protein KKA14_08395 [bacterium]|nr:hypothetical protein [bacterium]